MLGVGGVVGGNGVGVVKNGGIVGYVGVVRNSRVMSIMEW